MVGVAINRKRRWIDGLDAADDASASCRRSHLGEFVVVSLLLIGFWLLGLLCLVHGPRVIARLRAGATLERRSHGMAAWAQVPKGSPVVVERGCYAHRNFGVPKRPVYPGDPNYFEPFQVLDGKPSSLKSGVARSILGEH